MAQENSSLGKMAELSPLGRIKSTLAVPEDHDITRAEPIGQSNTAPSTANRLQSPSQLISPSKLREAIIINELLAPPLALRPRQPRTRHF